MTAIYRREVDAYFHSMVGCLYIAVLLFFNGIYFMANNLSIGYTHYSYAISGQTVILLLAVPVLTMRLFAEERRAGTENLLLTSRLTIPQIVLAKYLAAVTVFLITMLATLVYVGIIVTYGYPNLGALAASYLGYLLLGTAMIAVCTFTSSLADNQVTAAILSFGALFVLVMMSAFSRSMQVPIIAPVLRAMSITLRYDEFIRGIFRLGPVCYYIGYSIIFLFFAGKNMQRRRLN